MKSTPLIINWHDSNAPIYSADFQTGEGGRLATAGGDNNVRVCFLQAGVRETTLTFRKLWRLDSDGEDRKIDYLATLAKHTQAVNCVRWAPKGEVSFGDVFTYAD